MTGTRRTRSWEGRLLAVALAVLAAPSAAVQGQQVGDRLRATMIDGPTLVGQVVELTDTGVILSVDGGGREQEITPRRIRNLERSLGPRSGSRWKLGLLAGTGLGLASARLACGNLDFESECMDEGTGGTLVGAGILGGLLIGYLIKTEKWQHIPRFQMRVDLARTAGHRNAAVVAGRIPF